MQLCKIAIRQDAKVLCPLSQHSTPGAGKALSLKVALQRAPNLFRNEQQSLPSHSQFTNSEYERAIPAARSIVMRIKSIILFAVLALVGCAQSASAASPSDGLWFQSTNPAIWCAVASGDYPGFGQQTHVQCSVGDAGRFYQGNIPNVLQLVRRNDAGYVYVASAIGTISVSACQWRVLWGIDPIPVTMIKRPCTSVFVKPFER